MTAREKALNNLTFNPDLAVNEIESNGVTYVKETPTAQLLKQIAKTRKKSKKEKEPTGYYSQLVDKLKEIINRKRGKNTAQEFKTILKQFPRKISTAFLRNLIQDGQTSRQKKLRISYLIRRAGLKTERRIKFYRVWENQKRTIDITEYAHKKNAVIYVGDCVLTEQEEQQLKEIEEVKRTYGIELVKYPLVFSEIEEQKRKGHNPTLPERQNLRTAINSNGNNGTSGVYIKDIRSQHIGNFFKTGATQTYFFIMGF